MIKFSNKSKKIYFWPIFPICGTKKIKKKPFLSRTASHRPLTPWRVSEKTKEPISRKDPDIQDEHFWYCSQMWGDYSCPTMMKLVSYTLPKEDTKNVWITWHTPWVLLTTAFFQRKSASFAISRSTDIDCMLVHNFWFFKLFWSFLKIHLIKIVIILMMPAKLATLGLLKLELLWNKGYCVIYSVYDVTNKILPHDSNYIMDEVMWPKFSNSSICIIEVIITSIL